MNIFEEALFQRCIKKWGADLQKVVAMEECCELAKVISKQLRRDASREEVLAEIADVRIMLDQMLVILGFDEEEENAVRRIKIKRLRGKVG